MRGLHNSVLLPARPGPGFVVDMEVRKELLIREEDYATIYLDHPVLAFASDKSSKTSIRSTKNDYFYSNLCI